ncbi:MAG TPA: hypothetical protein VFP92_07095 [Rhodanobacteraceae bacterium]|nr:hypothetical protein [Rhodanobacteraceae bacterium]
MIAHFAKIADPVERKREVIESGKKICQQLKEYMLPDIEAGRNGDVINFANMLFQHFETLRETDGL